MIPKSKTKRLFNSIIGFFLNNQLFIRSYETIKINDSSELVKQNGNKVITDICIIFPEENLYIKNKTT